ncbi:MAG TPA: DNA methyltransferase [Solirubrobacterales bacterium]|nr:DNA methyltransferase [Solirubrobacterales bacterium]
MMLERPPLSVRAGWVLQSNDGDSVLEVPAATSTTYLTHGLFRYAGKVPPPLVAFLLDNHSSQGDLVVDPMCGGGTTAIEAVSSDREAVSFDVNPVARLVTEAVASPADVDGLLQFARELSTSFDPRRPPADLADFFSPASYGLIRSGLKAAKNAAEKALILSIARQASFANTKKINTVVDETKRPREAQALLAAAAKRFALGFDELNSTSPRASRVFEGHAGALPLPDESTDFVLLHPPYLTNTAFSESMHLQLLLLGAKPKSVRKSELAYRGSYFHVPNGLQKYLLGWAKILAEAQRILRAGGSLAVVIGDGRIEKVRVPVGSITEELASDLGLEIVERAMHRLNNQTGRTLSRRMTGQHVLVFRRP